jgi:hypothetical protein
LWQFLQPWMRSVLRSSGATGQCAKASLSSPTVLDNQFPINNWCISLNGFAFDAMSCAVSTWLKYSFGKQKIGMHIFHTSPVGSGKKLLKTNTALFHQPLYPRSITYTWHLKELTLHLVLPPFRLELLYNSERSLDSPVYHDSSIHTTDGGGGDWLVNEDPGSQQNENENRANRTESTSLQKPQTIKKKTPSSPPYLPS